MRNTIEVSIFEPMEKECTVVINVFEIPRVGDLVKILEDNSLRIAYEFQVDSIVHLCSKTHHIPALHCRRLG